MTVSVCCLLFSLLSANLSDLRQTARFTHQAGYYEANPAAAWLVDGPSPDGEIVSGVVALAGAVALERRNTTGSRAVMLAWTVAHVLAVVGNHTEHAEVGYFVAFPVLTVQW